MAKNVSKTFRIESSVRTSSLLQAAKTGALSAAERQRRIEAANYARASVGLEGFKLSAADKRHFLRHINGEIDMGEFVKGHDDVARDR